MKTRRVLSFMLCLVLMVSTSIPAFAKEMEAGFHNASIFAEVPCSDQFSKEKNICFENVSCGRYYTEITKDYTLSIGIINNIVDCSIKYNNEPSTIYSSILESSPNMKPSQSIDMQLLYYRDLLLSDRLALQVNKFSIFHEGTRGDLDLIMSTLYSIGWPKSYTDYLRETRYQNGVVGKLYHSVTYSFTRYVSWFAVATTTLSAVIALTNLPASVLLAIASFVLTAAGIYILVKDVMISRYNTFAYGRKMLYVQDIYQYNAGRTVKWLATVGDIGCSLELKYDTNHYDYFDHDALFSTAFYNYFNVPSY